MANETTLNIVGNLTADPELRYTQNGIPVCNFTIASTPRTFNKQTNEWDDGTTLYMRCTAWREPAEHIAATLLKGMRVNATGNLGQRDYEVEGVKRSSIELDVQEIGPALRYATAQVTRAEGKQQGQGGQQARQQPQQAQGSAYGQQQPQQSAYGQQAPQQKQQDVWNTPGNFSDETPF